MIHGLRASNYYNNICIFSAICLVIPIIYCIFAEKGKAMLGINSPRELVKGLFAQNVRDSLQRATTGNLTASEKKARQNLKNASCEWTIVWK